MATKIGEAPPTYSISLESTEYQQHKIVELVQSFLSSSQDTEGTSLKISSKSNPDKQYILLTRSRTHAKSEGADPKISRVDWPSGDPISACFLDYVYKPNTFLPFSTRKKEWIQLGFSGQLPNAAENNWEPASGLTEDEQLLRKVQIVVHAHVHKGERAKATRSRL